jgi:aminoglycoside phosphotransferase (APT) family kinase protein
MLRLSLQAEFAAAQAVAVKAGLGSVTPRLLHLGNHTTVRLAPWPIVGRIASGTSFDFSHEGLTRELVVASHLASRGAPAVRPTTQIAAGPYLENDCAVTLWDFVEGQAVATQADEAMAAASLKRVHTALADVEIDLPAFTTKVDSCKALLADPAEAPKLARSDRLFLETLYATLRERLSEAESAWRPLHGDTHMGNVLIGGAGAIWMDLEAACMGPLEWDVVNLPASTWRAFDGLDAELMTLFADVRSLCVAIWCWAEFERSAASAEVAIHHLRQLKARFR